jgi:hypothetical protein
LKVLAVLREDRHHVMEVKRALIGIIVRQFGNPTGLPGCER